MLLYSSKINAKINNKIIHR